MDLFLMKRLLSTCPKSKYEHALAATHLSADILTDRDKSRK